MENNIILLESLIKVVLSGIHLKVVVGVAQNIHILPSTFNTKTYCTVNINTAY